MTLVWDDVEMDSYNTSALSFVVTDGVQPIVGRTTPEEESAEEGNPFVDTFFRRPKLSELKFGRNYRAEE